MTRAYCPKNLTKSKTNVLNPALQQVRDLRETNKNLLLGLLSSFTLFRMTGARRLKNLLQIKSQYNPEICPSTDEKPS